MGTLLIIQGGAEKIRLNLGQVAYHLQLVRCRVHDVNPGTAFKGFQAQLLQWSGFQRFVNLQHSDGSPFVTETLSIAMQDCHVPGNCFSPGT